MSETSVYVANLRRFNLTFEEYVYAIAFELENDIQQKGKEAVFSELPGREQMAERVQKVFQDYAEKIFALRRVLGFPVADGSEGWMATWGLHTLDGLESQFRRAVSYLREGRWQGAKYIMPRRILLGDEPLWTPAVPTGNKLQELIKEFQLHDQICNQTMIEIEKFQALIKEWSSHNQKREQVFAEITKLLPDSKQREAVLSQALNNAETPSGAAGVEISSGAEKVNALVVPLSPESLDLQGPVSQLVWSYRSLQVLAELGINNLAEAVGYFSNFDNFVNAKQITLWEWAVITATLWRAELISAPFLSYMPVDLDQELYIAFYGLPHVPGLEVRTGNCLRRAGINTVQDLMYRFVDGAERGWHKIEQIRNLGRRSFRYLIDAMSAFLFVIPPELCCPTEYSSIVALDLGRDAMNFLEAYGVKTVGELIAARDDTNRFRGLRYLDANVYHRISCQLKKYGF